MSLTHRLLRIGAWSRFARAISLAAILLTSGMFVWLLTLKAGEDLPPSELNRGMGAGKIDLTFTSQGTKPGEQLPRLVLSMLDGQPAPLDERWHRPTLLLTSSLTCPKSRSRWPDAAKIIKKYGQSLDIAVVYVIEAHPDVDISPYKGVVDLTEQNVTDDILRRQPTTLEERLRLAREFKERLQVDVPIYVDGMNNAAWKALGGGPNMAMLVRRGVVEARQGWFEPNDLREKIDWMLSTDKSKASPSKASKVQAKRDTESAAKVRLEKVDVRMRDVARLVQSGATDELEMLLNRLPELATSADPYHYIGQGMTKGECLLPYAAQRGQFGVVDLLLERGADINVQGPKVPNALYTAAKAGQAETVRQLLDRRADVNRRSALGISPLDEAVIGEHSDVVRLLLKHDAQQDIFAQAGSGDLDALRAAIKQDLSRAFATDGDGRTPLVYAAAANQIAAARLLMAAGGLVKLTPPFRGEYHLRQAESPADWAALHGHGEMLNLLLDAGDPLAAGQLHDAVEGGHLAAVKVLLRHGASPVARDHYSHTSLHLAAVSGRPEVAQALIDAGADLEAKVGWHAGGGCGPPGGYPATNETPLHLAAKYGHGETVQVLLSAGAKLDARSKQGQTPLLAALGDGRQPLKSEQLEIVKLLLENGANVNAQDKSDDTPLSRAEAMHDEPLAALLRASGAQEGAGEPAEEDTSEVASDEHASAEDE